jgi:hypothetical protein
MAYLIYKSDGSTVTIPDNAIDTAYFNAAGGGGFGPGNVPQAGHGLGTQLVGRNTTDYGSAIAQNFLQLQQNFSSSAIPSDLTSLQGQLWFNQTSTTTGLLYVRVTTNTSGGLANWQKVVTVSSSETGTTPIINPSGTPKDGDIQVVGSVISIYAAGSWRQVFPAIYS